jgi:plasmid stability protein
MPNILVRDLPDDVHGALQQRAAQQGQSLQQYLTHQLTRLVERPTTDELFARIERRSGGSVGLERAVADLERERPAS